MPANGTVTDHPALISIHDVMPVTLPRVKALLARLADHGIDRVTLLVVPGLDWRPAQLSKLRDWQEQGHELAGHGWRHEARMIRGWRHRLHSKLLSRRAAEHLALDETGITALIRRCHGWFAAQGLTPPRLYVPPAWAMGTIRRDRLPTLPFRYYETLGGIYDIREGISYRLPLLGFEADTPARACGLRLWNRLNRGWSRWHGPLRCAIHPRDPELLLSRDLDEYLARIRSVGLERVGISRRHLAHPGDPCQPSSR